MECNEGRATVQSATAPLTAAALRASVPLEHLAPICGLAAATPRILVLAQERRHQVKIMAQENARRYPRYKGIKPVPVAWMQGTQKAVAKAENLSLGGLFISTPNPPPLGSLVLLLFHTPEGEVRVRAAVRNVKPGKGMGLAITSMEQDHRARLARWLQVLAAQAESNPAVVAAK